MGGKVALKGTGGPGVVEEARRRGAVPIAAERARRALARMMVLLADIDILTGRGELGEDVVRGLGFQSSLVGDGLKSVTTADDTRAAAAEMLALGAERKQLVA